MLEQVEIDGQVAGIILRSDYHTPGISFFTPDEYSQQLAYISHPAGKEIEPHTHNEVERSVIRTQEVLVIKKGVLRVTFYNDEQCAVAQRDLAQGDVILLASGGHGFEVIEDVALIEIKQGPYLGDDDKQRFLPRTA